MYVVLAGINSIAAGDARATRWTCSSRLKYKKVIWNFVIRIASWVRHRARGLSYVEAFAVFLQALRLPASTEPYIKLLYINSKRILFVWYLQPSLCCPVDKSLSVIWIFDSKALGFLSRIAASAIDFIKLVSGLLKHSIHLQESPQNLREEKQAQYSFKHFDLRHLHISSRETNSPLFIDLEAVPKELLEASGAGEGRGVALMLFSVQRPLFLSPRRARIGVPFEANEQSASAMCNKR